MRSSRLALLVAALLTATVSAGGDTMRLADAVRAGNRDAVRALLRGKTDVNSPEADGTTALHWAVQADDVEMARLLLAAGARAGAANRYGSTPLSLAAINGNPAMIEVLLAAGADPNAAVAKGQTVLMTAARTGNADAVKLLLDHGANVAAQEDLLGETALMWAASENHAAVVSLLIQRGAAVDARSKTVAFPKDRFGLEGVLTFLPRGSWTALMYAARDGAPDAARALADAGADLNAVDPEHATALIRAITNSHWDTAAVLIEHGADANVADSAGMGPLYAAVDMNSLGEVYGRPPRRVTDRLSGLDIMTMLLAHGADPNGRLQAATLTRAHTPGDPVLREGTTPLMRAAMHGDYRAMDILLAHGADATLAQKNGGNALMLASGLGRGQSAFSEDVGTESELFKAAQLALAHGADVTAVNDTGATALHYAARSGLNSIVTLLARNGAALEVKDKQGRTPVDAAVGVGARGRAGGPAIVHRDTAELITRLIAERNTGSAQR
jgi:ankyrin repeat protein